MGQADFYAPGDWNAVCSMCGKKFKASMLRKHWTGMYRCQRCWEPRHPQDFVRSVADNQSVPWSQPPVDSDIYIQICTFNGVSAIPGYASPGCMIPGRTVINPSEA